MSEVSEEIACADAGTLEILLKAVLRRYAQVYPDWKKHLISLHKGNDPSEQIDRIIEFLQKMKTSP